MTLSNIIGNDDTNHNIDDKETGFCGDCYDAHPAVQTRPSSAPWVCATHSAALFTATMRAGCGFRPQLAIVHAGIDTTASRQ